MVDTSGYSAGNFLNATDVQKLPEDQRFGVILEGIEFRETEFEGKKSTRLYIPVRLSDGVEKDFNCNKTSAKAIQKEWGTDSDSWIDRKIKFIIARQNVRGTFRDIVYAEPMK